MRIWAKRLAVTLLGVMVLTVSACGPGDRAGVSDNIEVKTAAASYGQVTTDIELVGTLVPARTANVFTKLTGLVQAINVDVGEAVKDGELLLTIDTKELRAQLEQAEAAVRSVQDQAAQLQISLDAAQLAYDRIKELAEAGAVPQSQLDDARTRLDLARSQYEAVAGPALAQAQAAVNTIRVNMSNAAVFSPISGTVTNRNINPGEMASPGSPLLTIADTANLKLEDTVPQEVVPLLAAGQEVKVTVDALPGREFCGRLTRVGPVAVTTGQRFPVEITLANPGELKAGMTARAVFQLTGTEGIVIPAAAVRTESGQDYVFVVKDGAVSKRPVTLGLKNADQVTVLEGLEKGEQVAVSNLSILQ